MIGATIELDPNVYHFLNFLKTKEQKIPIQLFLSGSIKEDDSSDLFSIESKKFKNQIDEIFFHAPMKCNPGSSEIRLKGYAKHLGFQVLDIARNLNAKAVVFHPGFNPKILQGHLNLAEVMKKLIIAYSNSGIDLLIENMAGQRNTLLGTIEHFSKIKRILPGVKFCIDTAHAFESGVKIADFDSFMKFIDEVGIDRVGLIHANDSKSEFFSHVDRHEILGEGFIGCEFFQALDRFTKKEKIPLVVELAGDIETTIDKWIRSLDNVNSGKAMQGKRSSNLLAFSC